MSEEELRRRLVRRDMLRIIVLEAMLRVMQRRKVCA